MVFRIEMKAFEAGSSVSGLPEEEGGCRVLCTRETRVEILRYHLTTTSLPPLNPFLPTPHPPTMESAMSDRFIPSASLANAPEDIIVQILSYVSALDVLAVRRVRTFRVSWRSLPLISQFFLSQSAVEGSSILPMPGSFGLTSSERRTPSGFHHYLRRWRLASQPPFLNIAPPDLFGSFTL